ncbi:MULTISPECIES: SRPBCC family protein [Vibrio]|uniref:SRPBCC family protein n=1 Tax=Vibrio TaxID=662 RepID=UPI000810E57E|nr:MULTISPECIES: SRPBCC family protein [Vibrio]ANW26547.1 hypothetical protein BA953_20555 [Vibrio coralliilyticus]
MNILKVVEINRKSSDVWKIVADQFEHAHTWMGFVVDSYALKEGNVLDGAPVAGRVCEFTDKPNGLKAKENILYFSEQDMRFQFDVVPFNAPKVFPVKKNIVTLSVKEVSAEKCLVTWESNIELSAFGYLAYPFLKLGLSKNFGQVLDDLRYHMENQNPSYKSVHAI